jgi:hypothetical protein
MEAWKQLEPVGRKHRGLVSLMRRRPTDSIRTKRYDYARTSTNPS